MNTYHLPYWGKIIGLVSHAIPSKAQAYSRSLFITHHSNGSNSYDANSQQQAYDYLYSLDNTATGNSGDKFTLNHTKLPCPMQAISQTGDDVITLLGQDGHLYTTSWQAKKINKVSTHALFDLPAVQQLKTSAKAFNRPIAMTALQEALVILYANHIVVWSYPQQGKAKHSQSETTAEIKAEVIVLPYLPPTPFATDGADTASDYDNNNDNNVAVAKATTLATSSDGQWLVVGDSVGNVSSYQWLLSTHNSNSDNDTQNDNKTALTDTAFGTLVVSSQKKIHEGRVTALCFEPIGSYFFSSGADKKLYRTHIQGDLYPLDRAKSSAHKEKITALCVSDSRLFSASDDKTIKSWAFDKGQPNTCSEDLTKTQQLYLTQVGDETVLVAVGTDQSLRFIPVHASGSADTTSADKLQAVNAVIKDGYARIKSLLTDTTAHSDQAFAEGLALLNDRRDNKTLDIVNQLLTSNNAKLNVGQILQLLDWVASTSLKDSAKILETMLANKRSAKIRLMAFKALAERSVSSSSVTAPSTSTSTDSTTTNSAINNKTTQPRRYLDVAIKSKYEDVVALALQGYLQQAMADIAQATNQQDTTQNNTQKIATLEHHRRQLLPIFADALQHNIAPIRQQALACLEALLPEDSPKADLMAITDDSLSTDIMQAGLIRLYQRGMLHHLEVSRQLMRLQSHADEQVRITAFYISVLSEPKLSEALKAKALAQGDSQLVKALADFEHFNLLRGTLLESLLVDTQDALNTQDLTHSGSYKALLNIPMAHMYASYANIDGSGSGSNNNSKANTSNTTLADTPVLELSIKTQDFVAQANTDASQKRPKNAKANATNSVHKTAQSDTNADARLDNASLEPLLQALGNPYADISFRASYSLACLHDGRAFGALIRLLRDDDSSIRAGVATALGKLAGDNSKMILPVLLDDKDASVRQVAMQAYGKLADDALAWASVGFKSAHQDIHEQALAIFLKQTANNQSKSRKKPASKTTSKKALNQSMAVVLQQALNNPFASIRQEVVKVLLNQLTTDTDTGTDGVINNVIIQLQQSLFEDVHQVALEEWQRVLLKANSKTRSKTSQSATTSSVPQSVLALFFADSFATIREQAFAIALKQHKQLSFSEVIITALASPYLDMRKKALIMLQNMASTSSNEDITTLMPKVVTLFADDSLEMRSLALSTALTLAKTTQSTPTSQLNHTLVESALASPYPDIQLKVARLLAGQTNSNKQDSKENKKANTASDSQAYAVFKHYLQQPMPTIDKNSSEYKDWHNYVSEALKGLADLSCPEQFETLAWYSQYLEHPDADFKPLALYLAQVVANKQALSLPATNAKQLIDWQDNEDKLLSLSASFALAVWGDARGQLFFNQKRTQKNNSLSLRGLMHPFTPLHWLQAKHGLGVTHANELADIFTKGDCKIAGRLLLAFYGLHEVMTGLTGTPSRLIEALSFADNESALFYANVLARLQTSASAPELQAQEGVWAYISQYLSQRLSTQISAHNLDEAIKSQTAKRSSQLTKTQMLLSGVSQSVLEQVYFALHSDKPWIKAQAVAVIYTLSNLLNFLPYSNQDSVLLALQDWQRSLHRLLGRLPHSDLQYSDLQPCSDFSKSSANTLTSNQPPSLYQELAFGTLLGVIREADDYDDQTTEPAIRGLMWLATQNTQDSQQDSQTNWQDSVSRVLYPLLNHSRFETRKLAWDSLQQLQQSTQLSVDKLAEQALTTTHEDMVQQGLALLVSSYTNSDTEEATEQANPLNVRLMQYLQTNNLTLAKEVYKLLKTRIGRLPASLQGLSSPSVPLRHQIVNEWHQVTPTHHPDQANDKLTVLKHALNDDNWSIRLSVFEQLGDFPYVVVDDASLINDLFDFWAQCQNAYQQSRVLTVIIDTITAYNAHNLDSNSNNNPDNNSNNNLDNNPDSKNVSQIVSRLPALVDSPHLLMHQKAVYDAIASLRTPLLFAPLLDKLGRLSAQGIAHYKTERQQLFDALITLTGFDQPIHDYHENQDNDGLDIGNHLPTWLQQQYPRYPKQLLALFNTLVHYGDYPHSAQLLRSLAWAKILPPAKADADTIGATEIERYKSDTQALSEQIDNALLLAYRQMPSQYTKQVVEAMAYRADKRGGSTKGLELALQSKDHEVQYLGAEGLAKCGSFSGLSILMATIDYHNEGDIRRRSVLALGELLGNANIAKADHQHTTSATNATHNQQVHALYQAYDKLINLAEDREHYLQDVASEALGRLSGHGKFEHSERIFELLKSQIQTLDFDDWDAHVDHWLNGLRWLDTPQAWAVIRDYIKRYLADDNVYYPQDHAISLLQYSDNEANKELLLDILRHPKSPDAYFDEMVLDSAYETAKKLWGNQSTTVYPYDWAVLRSHDEQFGEDTNYLSRRRVAEHSTISELVEFIQSYSTQLPKDNLTVLQDALLARADMPATQLDALLTSQNPVMRDLGVRYVTQYPNEYLTPATFEILQAAFDQAQANWHQHITKIINSPTKLNDALLLEQLGDNAQYIERLLWLHTRHLPYADDDTRSDLLALLTWLHSLLTQPILIAAPLITTYINGFWQRALLGLLARFDASDKANTGSINLDDTSAILTLLQTLRTASQHQGQSYLDHDNQALITQLVSALTHQPDNVSAPNTALSATAQIMAWFKAGNAQALYDWAQDGDIKTITRIQAIEALGQLHDNAVQTYLQTLLNTHTSDNDMNAMDDDLRKLTYKVLRRWQRMMTKAQRKRPAPFATVANPYASQRQERQGGLS